MMIGAKRITVNAAIAGAALLTAAGPAFADAGDRYYERTFVLAADAKCDLFRPAIAAALDAAANQARSAALRSGHSEASVAGRADRARARAAAVACGSSDLTIAAERVRQAFDGWSRQARMVFPGAVRDWKADRTAYARPTWRLAQQSAVGASPVAFGIAAGPAEADQLSAVVSFVGRPRPYAARIVLRDRRLAPRPWLAPVGGAALPPEAVRQTFWAAASKAAPAGLLAEGSDRGEVWTFPADAADALAGLDPREDFVIEFLFKDDSIASTTFETGDFAAGRAFLNLGAL